MSIPKILFGVAVVGAPSISGAYALKKFVFDKWKNPENKKNNVGANDQKPKAEPTATSNQVSSEGQREQTGTQQSGVST